jgi:hypothetical protein
MKSSMSQTTTTKNSFESLANKLDPVENRLLGFEDKVEELEHSDDKEKN